MSFVDFPMDHVFGEAHDDGGPGALTDPPTVIHADGNAVDAGHAIAHRGPAARHHGGHQRVVGTCRDRAA